MDFTPLSFSPSTSFSPVPSLPHVIMSPCAACKILRRRCVDNCLLAPYFPPTDPLRFFIAHKVFGASNIIKLLQELPEYQRTDAANSIVYEANVRNRDPVYGCAGIIYQLQKQVADLQADLAKAQAELARMQCHQANLSYNNSNISFDLSESQEQPRYDNSVFSFDSNNAGSPWNIFGHHV